MKALATVGAALGGGVVTGIAATGALAGMSAATLVNNTVLAASDGHDAPEAEAREIGRKASYAGAAAGVAGGVATIGAPGVTGFSAAGITSGLAAIGSVVGGGMAAGIALTVAAPVAAAAAVGYGTYKAAQRLKGDAKTTPTIELEAGELSEPIEAESRIWHLKRGEQQVGPVSNRELLNAAEQGQLEPTDMLWREGFSGWIALVELPKLTGPQQL